jgi:hypothetical protein
MSMNFEDLESASIDEDLQSGISLSIEAPSMYATRIDWEDGVAPVCAYAPRLHMLSLVYRARSLEGSRAPKKRKTSIEMSNETRAVAMVRLLSLRNDSISIRRVIKRLPIYHMWHSYDTDHGSMTPEHSGYAENIVYGDNGTDYGTDFDDSYE